MNLLTSCSSPTAVCASSPEVGGVGLESAADRLIGCATWTGTISPNAPDDPPPILPGVHC
jgi:hypothetical protein